MSPSPNPQPAHEAEPPLNAKLRKLFIEAAEIRADLRRHIARQLRSR